MTVCPKCKKGVLHPLRYKKPFHGEVYCFRCSFCFYEIDKLPDEEESEAQRLMREHLRDYHGVE